MLINNILNVDRCQLGEESGLTPNWTLFNIISNTTI